ncbi:MAG: DUF5058 family protein [Oscillospiraceae bacterium]|jgi:hypothetical protein|nr:DUF5058 family protein [Oscillospiraceae bacterium]
MSYLDASGHRITYLTVAAGIAYILGLTLVVMRKSWRRALKTGYTRRQLVRIVKVSSLHALVPSVAVLVGFFTLAPLLGIPLSWWRLSVIGNVTYEIIAADTAFSAAGVTDIAAASSREFVLVIYVMALSIMGGMVISTVISRRIHRGIFKMRAVDRGWSALSVGTYMTAIAVVFTVPLLFRLSVSLLTMLTGAGATVALTALKRGRESTRLDEFSFTISVVAAMLSSVLWERLLN